MPHRILSCAALMALLLLASPARAAEAPQPDPRAFLLDLHEQMRVLAIAPKRTEINHGRYDVWAGALKPRFGRMRQDLKDMSRAQRWWIDVESGRAVRLLGEAWPRWVAKAGSLYTSMGAALDAYRSADIKITNPYGIGIDRPAAPPTTTPIEALDVLAYERELHRRLRLRGVLWEHEVYSYRVLLARLQAERARRAEAQRRFERALANRETAEELAEGHQASLDAQVERIGMFLLSLRTLMAMLQVEEEHRLRGLLLEAPWPDATKAKHLRALGGMREARLNAREHGGSNWGAYGRTLRAKWILPRRALLFELSRIKK